MFKIRKILIEGFKSPNRKVELNFVNPISILYGDNGCGKTTILKIIHALFSQDDQILLYEKVNTIEMEYSTGDDASNQKIHNAKVFLEINDDGSYNYNWDSFNTNEFSNTSSILFGVNRGITNTFSKINQELIERFLIRSPRFREIFDSRYAISSFSKELTFYLNDIIKFQNRNYYSKKHYSNSLNEENLLADNLNISVVEELLVERYRLAKRLTSERVQKALFDTLSLAINPRTNGNGENDKIPNNFSELLVKNKERLIEALNNAAENTLRNQIIDILNGYSKNDTSIIYNPSNKLLCNLLYKMISELERDQILLDSVNLLVDVFNDQISSDKKLVIDQNKAYIDLGNENTHTLNELSSGERHLLTFLTIFIIDGCNRDILMIDEPEISLNIKWQRRIMQLLHQLAPKSQIIAASHSPAISSNIDQLVELKVSKYN